MEREKERNILRHLFSNIESDLKELKSLYNIDKLREIKDLAKNLIEAIDSNCFEGKDLERENDTDIFITQRFIADELEELRRTIKENERV